MNDFKFDIAIRTWIVGAVIGFMANRLGWIDSTGEASTLVGAVVAAIYDYIAFLIKAQFAPKKQS